MGDTLTLKPFVRTSKANRSAFSRLANTPSCTAHPDSAFGGDGLVAFGGVAFATRGDAARGALVCGCAVGPPCATPTVLPRGGGTVLACDPAPTESPRGPDVGELTRCAFVA